MKVEDHDVSKVNFYDGYMYNKPAFNLCTDVRVTFRNDHERRLCAAHARVSALHLLSYQ